jgi:hypothetical protein
MAEQLDKNVFTMIAGGLADRNSQMRRELVPFIRNSGHMTG